MPTDFSFVSDQGWEMLRPKFESAERKLDEKVKRKELTEDQARKMKDLMWSKYDHWAKGKGMKEKENQTVFNGKPTKKASAMQREARIGRTQLIDILNAITDGTIQNPAVFAQTLDLNKITPDEFFTLMGQDVVRYPQLYPKQYIGYISELFTDWGYEGEVKKVVDQARGAVGPQQPASYEHQAPPVPQTAPSADAPKPTPAPAPAPAAPPAPEPAVSGESVESLAPKPDQFKVEPQTWPEKLPKPQPSAQGQTYRWYLQFVMKGEAQPRAAIVDGVGRQDMLNFIHETERGGAAKFRIAKPVSQAAGGAPAAAPAPAKPAKAPAAPAAAPAAKPPEQEAVGQIDTPDTKDPVTYRWYVKYRLNSGHETAVSPDFTGIQMEAMMRRLEQMGIKILEMKKMSIAPKSSLTIDDSDIRLAGEGDPVEKFRNGTPIIFTEDVNLEFDALSARGQIKKNMTGKIKKVEDNDYLIDIAGQLYRVPRLVAEHVMDVFAANVVPHADQAGEAPAAPGQQPGQNPAQQPPAQPQKAQAPAAKPAAQAPGQNQGQLPPGGAPKMPAGMAKVLSRIVVAESDEMHGNESFFGEMGMDADAQTQYMRERNPCDVCPHMSSAHDFSDGGNYACQLCAQEGGPCATGYPENGPESDPILSGADGRIVVADFEIEAMAMSNKMLARAFANGATSGKGSHMFIEGDTIYSYGRHFPIATRGEDGTIYLTTKTYSVSTARQISHVRSALNDFVYSDQTANGKVLKPTPEEIANREKANAEAEAKRTLLDQKRRLREQKKTMQQRQQVPEERAQDIAETENKNLDDKAYIEQHDDRGRPLKYRIDRTLAPSTMEETPSLTPEQWMSRIQDIEDQLLRETDPERQEKLRQRMERMKQASWQQSMTRLAGTDNPLGGEKADFADLQKVIRDKDKNVIREQQEKKDHPVLNHHDKKAAVETTAFSDLLLLIESGAPGIPSDIGKRLYRADGAVSRASA